MRPLQEVRVPTAGAPLAALRAPAPAEVTAPVAATGTPAVLVPGFTGSKEDFAAVLPLLVGDGREVLAYDQRGQYRSPGPHHASAYSLDALAADLLDVVGHLGGRAHVVGHSLGGLVARVALLARPSACASLVLLSSGPAALAGARRTRLVAMRELLSVAGPGAVWTAMEAEARQDPGYAEVPVDVRQLLVERFAASSPVGLDAMAAVLLSEPDRTDALRDAARTAGVPLLVAFGDADDAWSPQVQAETAHRLGCPVAVVAGARHSPAAEQPGRTARVLTAFWSQADGDLDADGLAPRATGGGRAPGA